jgi:hypothetical protein
LAENGSRSFFISCAIAMAARQPWRTSCGKMSVDQILKVSQTTTQRAVKEAGYEK